MSLAVGSQSCASSQREVSGDCTTPSEASDCISKPSEKNDPQVSEHSARSTNSAKNAYSGAVEPGIKLIGVIASNHFRQQFACMEVGYNPNQKQVPHIRQTILLDVQLYGIVNNPRDLIYLIRDKITADLGKKCISVKDHNEGLLVLFMDNLSKNHCVEYCQGNCKRQDCTGTHEQATQFLVCTVPIPQPNGSFRGPYVKLPIGSPAKMDSKANGGVRPQNLNVPGAPNKREKGTGKTKSKGGDTSASSSAVSNRKLQQGTMQQGAIGGFQNFDPSAMQVQGGQEFVGAQGVVGGVVVDGTMMQQNQGGQQPPLIVANPKAKGPKTVDAALQSQRDKEAHARKMAELAASGQPMPAAGGKKAKWTSQQGAVGGAGGPGQQKQGQGMYGAVQQGGNQQPPQGNERFANLRGAAGGPNQQQFGGGKGSNKGGQQQQQQQFAPAGNQNVQYPQQQMNMQYQPQAAPGQPIYPQNPQGTSSASQQQQQQPFGQQQQQQYAPQGQQQFQPFGAPPPNALPPYQGAPGPQVGPGQQQQQQQVPNPKQPQPFPGPNVPVQQGQFAPQPYQPQFGSNTPPQQLPQQQQFGGPQQQGAFNPQQQQQQPFPGQNPQQQQQFGGYPVNPQFNQQQPQQNAQFGGYQQPYAQGQQQPQQQQPQQQQQQQQQPQQQQQYHPSGPSSQYNSPQKGGGNMQYAQQGNQQQQQQQYGQYGKGYNKGQYNQDQYNQGQYNQGQYNQGQGGRGQNYDYNQGGKQGGRGGKGQNQGGKKGGNANQNQGADEGGFGSTDNWFAERQKAFKQGATTSVNKSASGEVNETESKNGPAIPTPTFIPNPEEPQPVESGA